MAFTVQEQEFYDHARASLPRALFQDPDAVEDWIAAFAKVFGLCRLQADDWRAQAYILDAAGIWLDQHARDRDLRRTAGETDAGLRDRVRAFEDVVNPAAVVAAATAALTAASVTIPVGYPGLVETKRDAAHLRQHSDSPSTSKAFLSRGYRMRSLRGSIIVILPYGTSESTRVAVDDQVRHVKAGGFKSVVERRVNP